MIDTIFNAFLQVVGYQMIAGVMATFVLFELGFTFFENVDML